MDVCNFKWEGDPLSGSALLSFPDQCDVAAGPVFVMNSSGG